MRWLTKSRSSICGAVPAEDEPLALVELAPRAPVLLLLLKPRPHRLDRVVAQVDGATARPGLRLAETSDALGPLVELLHHRQPPCLPVDVRPPQPEQLAAPHAGLDGQPVESLVVVIALPVDPTSAMRREPLSPMAVAGRHQWGRDSPSARRV
jgi:hypothetical protein